MSTHLLRILLALFSLDSRHFTLGGQVYITEHVCLNDNNRFRLVCPGDHLIIVGSAKYFRAEAGCAGDQENSCLLQDVSTAVRAAHNLDMGAVNIALEEAGDLDGCNHYNGDVFFQISYKCEPSMFYASDRARPIDLCSSTTWQGSLVYLWNDNFPLQTIENNCSCHVSAHHETEFLVKLAYFDTDGHASQFDMPTLRLRSHGDIVSNLHPGDASLSPLDFTANRALDVYYYNPDMLMTRYILIVQVSHLDNLTVTCNGGTIPTASLPEVQTLSPEIQNSILQESTTASILLTNQSSEVILRGDLIWTSDLFYIIIACIGLALLCIYLLYHFRRFVSRGNKRTSFTTLAFDNMMYTSENGSISGDLPHCITDGTSTVYVSQESLYLDPNALERKLSLIVTDSKRKLDPIPEESDNSNVTGY